MSVVNALLEQLRWDMGDEDARERLRLAKINDHSIAHFDWKGAEAFAATVEMLQAGADFKAVCRAACRQFTQSKESLIRLVSRRDAFVGNLSSNETEVFRNAGLLDPIPAEEAVEWWDSLRSDARQASAAARLEQGRLAERWTLERERARLTNEGCELAPVWIALEGDSHGYDVLSYALTPEGTWVNLVIEVKSYASHDDPSFFISRREWGRAELSQPHYELQVWSIQTQTVNILRYQDIEPHIPVNQVYGRWENAQIRLGSPLS